MSATPETADVTTETPLVRPTTTKKRFSSSDLDLRNTWPIAAGAILVPLGVAGIILGWSGAAHGNVDQQQIPYLISGGILGLAGVIIGCFLYWSHWLYRIYDQADLHHQEVIREQREMIRALLEATHQRPSVVPDGAAAVAAGAASNSSNGSAFIATPTGTNFHTAGCPIIANRLPNVRVVSEEEANSMKPCRVCEPLSKTH
jgi:hypothetical protein